MEYKEVSPDKLQIDSINERKDNVGPHKDEESLVESIKSKGIIHEPIVRKNNEGYKVVVGQRRTLAAQSAGLEKITVKVVDWDDVEALEASITENLEVFKKGVSRKDRAAAIQKLIELTDANINEVADRLGVSRDTVNRWLERTRDEWEDTVVHVDESGDGPIEIQKDIDTLPEDILTPIRTQTDDKEEREEVVETVVESDLSRKDVRNAKKEAERSGQDFKEVIEKKSEESNEVDGSLRVRTETTFTGDYAEGLIKAAEDRGTTEEQIVKEAIDYFLQDEGYI